MNQTFFRLTGALHPTAVGDGFAIPLFTSEDDHDEETYIQLGEPDMITGFEKVTLDEDDVVLSTNRQRSLSVGDRPLGAFKSKSLGLLVGNVFFLRNALEGIRADYPEGSSLRRVVDAFIASQSDMMSVAKTPTRSIVPAELPEPSIEPDPIREEMLPLKSYDVMVVGAGFAGSVMAERLAADAGKRVLVIDRRSHIGGNAYDESDAAGFLIHRYGPHIFHTNSTEVFDYLSRFTGWRAYEHRVLADVNGTLVPIPINRTTLNTLYGLQLSTDEEAAAFLASRAEPVEVVRTSEDVVVSAVGHELYETFFRGYTRKQWGLDPSELDKAVTARVPTRTNTDDRYFADRFQAMPEESYTRMFERILDHPNITLELGVEYRDIIDQVDCDHIVFTGMIDEYFEYRYGKLPYRSLRFRHETLDVAQHQPVAVINYPSESVPYTRVTEYKHLTGQVAEKTSITYEYAEAEGEPYYPIPRADNQALFKRYEALALAEKDVTFVGRLATYRYYNMDQVVGQALATYRRLNEKLEQPDRRVEAG